MKCKIDGCERDARYLAAKLCQMHYFRIMRNGTPDLVRSRKYRLSNPAGYQKIHEPNHPLVNSDGYVYEHRAIVYSKYGQNLPDCEICGGKTNWQTCHIDHIDEDVTNNNPENLRPICRGCNTGRTERCTIKKFEYKGQLLSITELAKLPGVQVCRAMVKRRLDSGMSIHDALFSKNRTHGKK